MNVFFFARYTNTRSLPADGRNVAILIRAIKGMHGNRPAAATGWAGLALLTSGIFSMCWTGLAV